MFRKHWLMAKRPTMTGIKERPPIRNVVPKAKRVKPVMLSTPTKDKRSPKHPDRSPFKSDLPEMLAIMLMPKKASANVSGALNFRAMFARIGEMTISKRPLIMPPPKEATVEIPKALPDSPLFVKGYPSKMVAAAEGVPGVLIRIAVMEPP